VASQFDIVIVGGSFGGVSAALSAGRYGKRVALVDARGNVGGQATAQGLTRWDAAPVLSPNRYVYGMGLSKHTGMAGAANASNPCVTVVRMTSVAAGVTVGNCFPAFPDQEIKDAERGGRVQRPCNRAVRKG
jgi:hypothetical protein